MKRLSVEDLFLSLVMVSAACALLLLMLFGPFVGSW